MRMHPDALEARLDAAIAAAEIVAIHPLLIELPRFLYFLSGTHYALPISS
jgi:hypothetical protein